MGSSIGSSRLRTILYFSLLFILLGWAVFARFGDLTADAAFHISKSPAIYFDPFSHSGNARSYLLFGDLHPDQWNTYAYSPIFVLLQIVWFSIFGISTASMHAYGATWSILGVAIAWACFRSFGKLAGVLALLFFGSHYIFAQMGRLALLENSCLLFLFLALFCLSKPLTKWRAICCGAAGFLVFVCKATVFYAVPAIGFGVLAAVLKEGYGSRDWKKSATLFGWYLAGTLLIFLPWLYLFRIPNHEEISRLAGVWWESVRAPGLAETFEVFVYDFLFSRTDRHDFVSVIALGMAGGTVYRVFGNWKNVNPLAVGLVALLVLGGSFFGILAAKSTRMTLPIFPAILGLGIIGLMEFYQAGRLTKVFRKEFLANLIGIVTLTLVIGMCVPSYDWGREFLLELRHLTLGGFDLPIRGPLGALYSLAGCFLFGAVIWCTFRLLVLYLVKGEQLLIPKWGRGALVLLFSAHFLYGNLSAHSRWWNDRRHTIVNVSRSLKDQPHMVIGGLSVHALVMETTHRAVRIQHRGWHNSIGTGIFTELGLTHLLLTDFDELRRKHYNMFPRQMKKLTLERKFMLTDELYYLFKLQDPWTKGKGKRKKKKKKIGN